MTDLATISKDVVATTNSEVLDLTRDPAFLIGMEHVNEAGTPKAKLQRKHKLAAKLGIDEATLEAAILVTPMPGVLLKNTASGYYRLTRDIPNPFFDKRVSDRDLNSREVLPAGTMVVVEHRKQRADYKEGDWLTFIPPRVEVFGEVHGDLPSGVMQLMVLSNMEPAPVQNLRDAIRVDDMEDWHFQEIVMHLLDQKRISLDEVRNLARVTKSMDDDDETAFYQRHGFRQNA